MVQYYTKLKKLWDELAQLMPFPECNCGAAKRMSDMDASNIDAVRNQILMLDPLPTANKAFSMVLKVEKQKQVHTKLIDLTENSALLVKVPPDRQGAGRGAVKNKDSAGNRSGVKCDFCQGEGHTRDTCFQIN